MDRITSDNEKMEKIKSLKVGEHAWFAADGIENQIGQFSCFKYNFVKITEEKATELNLNETLNGRNFNCPICQAKMKCFFDGGSWDHCSFEEYLCLSCNMTLHFENDDG